MPDLKLTREDALKLVKAEADKYVRYLRDEAERIAEMLTATSAALMYKRPLDIANAEVAAVIELEQQSDSYGYRANIQLSLSGPSGGCCGTTELGRGLRSGRYRAVILIDRIGDE